MTNKGTKKSKPTIIDRAKQRICPECGQPTVRRSDRGRFPTFCCPEHKKSFENRHIAEGLAVIRLLKAWRIDRGTGEIAQQSFAQVCQIVDLFNSEDAQAGRPRADLYAAKLLVDGSIFLDRRRDRKSQHDEERD